MLRSSLRALPLFLVPVTVLSTWTVSASAEPRPEPNSRDNGTIASALFEEGRKLVAAGKYDEACPKFAESQRLVNAGGTILNLALCHEKAGKKALAVTEYEEALAVATRDGRKERVAFAKKQIAILEPQLAKLTVNVPADDVAAPGLEVRVDGIPLPRAAFGIAVKVDAGPHLVLATADKKREFRGEIPVNAKEAKAISVALSPPVADPEPVVEPKVDPPKVDPTPPLKVDPVVPPKIDPPVAPSKPRTEIRKEGHPLALPFILAGATGLVTGLAVGGYAANKLLNPSVGGSCFNNADNCADSSAKSRRNAGRTGLWVSGTALGLGTIFLITGVALPSREVIVKTGGLRLRVTPTVDGDAHSGSIGLRGSF